VNETHDIFLRALAIPDEKDKGKKSKDKDKGEHKRSAPANTDSKWPEYALVFDTETRITADQSLTFGVWRLCKLVEDSYTLIEEGIFYADDLPATERKVLEAYVRTAIMDVASFPPRFPLYTRSEFMKKVFWPAIKKRGAMVVGFNLPFDLSRLALAWSQGEQNEWSFTMSQYPDGEENRNCPRILIKPIDSKKAFINLAPVWKPEEWKGNDKAHFLDLRTFAWSLYNKSFSLKRLCEELKIEHQKLDHDPTGKVTPEEIEYARQDGRCTVDALNALKHNFDKHPSIELKPWSSYSAASMAKSYLDAMGIIQPAEKFEIPDEIVGIAMQSYYGGRSETRIRCAEVPCVPVDFMSQYPSVCALLGLFDVLTAESVSFEDDTENVRKFLKQITLEKCLKLKTWEHLKFFALIRPDKDILPVRTVFNGITQNIGNDYLSANPSNPQPQWFASPDLIASVLLTGKAPHIIRAISMVPHGRQAGMRSVNLRGMVEIDPYRDDLFRKVIEQRKLHKADAALYYWLKILANSIYGFFVELNPETHSKKVPVRVFLGEATIRDSSDVIEKPGRWFFAPLASLITSGGRLLLAMTEASVKEKRGTHLFCDTDSLCIVASKRGGPLHIPGSKGVRILSRAEVQTIVEEFAALNPYDRKIVKGSILNLTDANFEDSDPKNAQRQLYGYSLAAKRYALHEKIGDKDIEIVDPKAHGIGFLYPPKNSSECWEEENPEWVYEAWDYIVRGALKLKRKAPSWLDLPQMMRLTITTFNVLKMLGEWAVARPYNFLLLPMVSPLYGYPIGLLSKDKVLLVTQFDSHQDQWFDLECINIHSGKAYGMATEHTSKLDKVIPKTFVDLLYAYQRHPEAKSLAPDGGPCEAETSGLLQRAHVIAGELRYVGKETDRKWEEGDDISMFDFKTIEYGREGKVVASEEVKKDIRKIHIKKCVRESGFTRFVIRRMVRGEPVKRNSYTNFVRWLQNYKSHIGLSESKIP